MPSAGLFQPGPAQRVISDFVKVPAAQPPEVVPQYIDLPSLLQVEKFQPHSSSGEDLIKSRLFAATLASVFGLCTLLNAKSVQDGRS